MSALTRFLNNRKNRDYKTGEKVSKAYRRITNISIIGVFIACGLLVLGFTKIISLTAFVFGLISIVAIISIACLLLLPWIKYYGRGELKKISLLFMIFIVVCAILWIISVCVGINLYVKAKNDVEVNVFGSLTFLKVSLIISLQFLMASLIAGTIVKFRKSMILFQAITYISNLFFDFYITYLLICLRITSDGLEILEGVKLLGNKVMLTLFLLSIIYMMISNAIMKRLETRRIVNEVEENHTIKGTKNVDKQEDDKTPEEKLEKLKILFEKNLITKEEYEQKRADILKDM